MPRPTVSNKTKTMRRRMNCSYSLQPVGKDAFNLTAQATFGTYLRKGEQFILGIYIYEAVSRERVGEYDRWQFHCKQVRKLTREEFVESKWPPEVRGTAW